MTVCLLNNRFKHRRVVSISCLIVNAMATRLEKPKPSQSIRRAFFQIHNPYGRNPLYRVTNKIFCKLTLKHRFLYIHYSCAPALFIKKKDPKN